MESWEKPWFSTDHSLTWRKQGRLHRIDGPALIHPQGSFAWYLNGKLHRENGPAFISREYICAWYIDGKLHREDGPAIIRPDGSCEWWLNHKRIAKPTRRIKPKPPIPMEIKRKIKGV